MEELTRWYLLRIVGVGAVGFIANWRCLQNTEVLDDETRGAARHRIMQSQLVPLATCGRNECIEEGAESKCTPTHDGGQKESAATILQ